MFEDRSDRVADAEPFRGYGVAVTIGSDGPCTLVGGYGDANRIYTFRDGRLRNVASPAVADPNSHALGVIAADLDADGHEELYVHNADRFVGDCSDADLLLDAAGHLPDEPGQWRDLFGLADNVDRDTRRPGRSLAAVDRYGTGRYGVFLAGYAAPSRFYEVGEDDQVSDMAVEVGVDISARACSTVAGPLVSDRTDLYVGVEDGPNRLFRNVGGRFVEVADEMGVSAADTNARGVTLVHDAVAVGAWEGPNRLYTPATATDGGVRYADDAPAEFAAPSRVRTLVPADFDNDGHDELFVNALGTDNRLFRAIRADGEPVSDDSPGTWSLDRIDAGDATEPQGLGTGAAVADFNNDGVLELLVVHGELEPGTPTLYRARDPCERSIRVRPTTPHGAPARGAVVTLETDRWVRRKFICAGSGYLCQMEPTAHFGLGTAEPERLSIGWPDGRETNHDPPRVGNTVEIAHPSV